MSDTDFDRLNILIQAQTKQYEASLDRAVRKVNRFSAKTQKSLSKASQSFDMLGAAAKRFGPLMTAAAGAAAIAAVKRTVSALDDIGKTADKIGVTTDALQELRTVAESAGVSQSSLDSSLERFSKRLGEATLGFGAAAAALKEMGLNADKLAAKGVDAALSDVADAMASIASPTERAARAAQLFGREGVAMVGLLKQGSAGMEEMRADARALGIVLDEKLIRSSEAAQTQLDLMGRVISANLNNALITMAPLLVTGATAVADLAQFLGSAATATREFLQPSSVLDLAIENLVTAMGDEIVQSQILAVALAGGANMSIEVANRKLDEAKARHANAKAAIAEQRALAIGSDRWAELTEQIEMSQHALNTMGFPSKDVAVAHRAAAFEEEQLRIVALITERQSLLKTDKALEDQLQRTAENLAVLQDAIDTSKGDRVVIGDYVDPIDNSGKDGLGDAGSAAAAAVPELRDYEAVVERINAAFKETKVSGSDYLTVIERLKAMHEAGLISAEEYNEAIGAVGEEFTDVIEAAKTMEGATEDALASIVTRSASAGDALAGLADQFAMMAAKAAFSGLFGGVFDAIAPVFTAGASFDGGGMTPDGPRAGGLDGKGGFLAMLHPREQITDLTKPATTPSGGGGGGGLSVSVTVNGARGNSEITEMVTRGVEAGLMQYDRNVLPRSVARVQSDPRGLG